MRLELTEPDYMIGSWRGQKKRPPALTGERPRYQLTRTEARQENYLDQKFNRNANWIWRFVPNPTVLATVEFKRPKLPAAALVNGWPGCIWFAPVPNAFGRVEGGLAKFAWLKRLKNSARNSRLVDSASWKRLFSTISNCRKSGPCNWPRLRFPSVPGAGMANAAGLRN